VQKLITKFSVLYGRTLIIVAVLLEPLVALTSFSVNDYSL